MLLQVGLLRRIPGGVGCLSAEVSPDSVIATNLKACNYFRMYSGKVAEAEIKGLVVRRPESIKRWNIERLVRE